MRQGIISDIHGQHIPLEIALKRLEQLGVDEVVCLGDIIGDGKNTDSNRCVDIVRANCERIINGNHDGIWRIYKGLTRETIDFIKSLPIKIVIGDNIFVHRHPLGQEYNKEKHRGYIQYQEQATEVLDRTEYKRIFLGHVHEPTAFTKDSKIDFPERKKIKLDENERYILNPGPIFMRETYRGKTPCFAIFDSKEDTFEIIR